MNVITFMGKRSEQNSVQLKEVYVVLNLIARSKTCGLGEERESSENGAHDHVWAPISLG